MLNVGRTSNHEVPPAPPAIAISGLSKRFGTNDVLIGADLHVAAGSVLALLGPSGCGKTTLLRLLAGLEVPDAGTIRVGDRVLADASTFVPPERRRIGLVFQDWALFPHLSVGRNVAFGLQRSADRAARVRAALAMVGLDGFEDRSPATLSGGQQQRVALARAIAPEPAVLLLDEPFSNLDAALRAQVRGEIHELLVGLGITTVVVTHDQEEAFVLGDMVALLHDGRIVQHGSPGDIYRRPASRWVAEFVGDANLVPASAHGRIATCALGDIPLDVEAAGAVEVLVRPEDLLVDAAPRRASGGDEASAGATATVDLVEFYGHDTVVLATLGDGERVRIRVAGAVAVARGSQVLVRHRGTPTVAFAVPDADPAASSAVLGVPAVARTRG
jgi:iron(III) transport system ATP-binding protein